jgi:hypothetical protein
MESNAIHHAPRHLNHTLFRRLEIERDIMVCPEDEPGMLAKCPNCDCVMVYRGIGRLRSGTKVHYFECIHSPREVYSVSLVIAD